MRRRLVLLGILLPVAALVAFILARSLQGPVRGRVELADGAPRDDLVVLLHCLGGTIHGSHGADTRLRVFDAREPFRVPWAWRGLFPAGCYVELLHPLYRMEHVPFERRFAVELGTLRLEPWDALLASPADLVLGEVHRHVWYLRHYYLDAFPEAARERLARYVPELHALYDRALRTVPERDEDRFGSNEESLEGLRAIEAAVGYARPAEQEALFAAAAGGDAERVRALLREGADADAWNAEHEAAIHLAARAGHAEVVRALLDAGADVDRQQEGLGDSALLLALREHEPAVALLLLERGADPALTSRGTTPLYQAARGGMLEVVHALLARGPGAPGDAVQALSAAAGQGQAEVVRTLLAAGVPSDGGLPGWTALMQAAANGHLRAADVLLAAGADPNAVSSTGKTPLGLARENQRVEMIALLETRGAVK
jgi:ankyrin repeat protein